MTKRLLILNPNTSAGITAGIVAQARRHLPPWVEVVPQTARFGAPVIATAGAFTQAEEAVLDAFAQVADPVDAVLLACFGDPGLHRLRLATAPMPVIGLAEACFLAASTRFAVLTLGPDWRPILLAQAEVARPGACVGVWALDATGADFVREPEPLLARLNAACAEAAEAGAACVILGGAVLAGVAGRLRVSVPLMDCVQAAAAAVVVCLSNAENQIKPKGGRDGRL